MLDFICPACGHFSLENETCATCETPAADDLVA
jgi:ribosomal protein L32